MSDSETEGDGQEQGQDETAQAPPTRRSLRITLPTQDELDRLPAEVRLELRDRHRAERHQWLNSLGILFGVLFTAGSLVATGLALRTSQEDLRVTRESQLTDRYAKALEALADDDVTIRLGAVHAFNRLLTDSPRDRDAITALLAGYTREHDPAPTIKQAKLPKDPSTDIAAALTTLANNPHPVPPLDLHQIRTPHISLPEAHFNKANLNGADLNGANLTSAHLNNAGLNGTHLNGANLSSANLSSANLSSANLYGANLYGANLNGANLNDANLNGTNLSSANLNGTHLSSAYLNGTNLSSAYLSSAYLNGAHLSSANLNGTHLNDANLTDANLTYADLSGAYLTRADLSGADLTGAKLSQSVDEIRRIAKTDIRTKF